MINENESASLLTGFNDTIRIFRTDLVTKKGCGNKQFKLSENLLLLKNSGAEAVMSFGGLWSNHLHAFSIACEAVGLQAVAAVRGEERGDSALLCDARKHGLRVHYVSRSDYRRRHDALYTTELMRQLHCDAYLPEGGSNDIAVHACAEIARLLNACSDQPIQHIAVAVGTGATMAGIVNGASARQHVIGVPVVQDARLQSVIEGWTSEKRDCDWTLLDAAYPARYGKVDQPLLEFVLQVYSDTGVILDPVYNAKALRTLLSNTVLSAADEECVFIHTGGIGGCLGFAEGLMAIDQNLAGQLLGEVRRVLELDA